MLRGRLPLFIVILLLIWPIAPSARATVVCIKTDADGTCLLTIDDGTGSGGGGGSAGGGSAQCHWEGTPKECTSDLGRWSNTAGCYLRRLDPQPDPTDLDRWGNPIGEHPGQLLFSCRNYGDQRDGSYPYMWINAAPAAPDPVTLARQAISQMNLSAVQVGIVPDPIPGRVGIIGMPTWMWADAPTESTVGPITRSASSGGYTVTATATLKRIVWNMGDGSVVTCNGPGTKYEDKYGKTSSPTCGHTYTRQGAYTVTATSYWEVAWNGIGQAGTIPLNFSRSAAITMGEVQVINT